MLLLLSLLVLAGDIEINPGPPISLWHCNVRGLNTEKMEALRTEVQGKFDILAITESLLCGTSQTDLFLQGYLPIFRRDRGQGAAAGGGVALYVSSDLVAVRKQQFELPGLETLCVEITVKKQKLLLCVCYRPPNTEASFWDEFQDSYDLIRQADYQDIIITGDLTPIREQQMAINSNTSPIPILSLCMLMSPQESQQTLQQYSTNL